MHWKETCREVYDDNDMLVTMVTTQSRQNIKAYCTAKEWKQKFQMGSLYHA